MGAVMDSPDAIRAAKYRSAMDDLNRVENERDAALAALDAALWAEGVLRAENDHLRAELERLRPA